MEKYTFAKKATAIVLHQFVFLGAITSAFAADYFKGTGYVAAQYACFATTGFGMLVAFATILYLANAISSFHAFDKIGIDIQFLIFALVCYGTLSLVLPVDKSYALADRLVAVGVVAYLLDALFLLFLSSFITQLKDKRIVENCAIVRLVKLVAEGLFKHTMLARALRGFIAWMIGIAGAAVFFIYHSWWGIAMLVVSGCIELYFSLAHASEEKKIRLGIMEITKGNLDGNLDEAHFHGEQQATARAVNHIRDGLDLAVKEGIKNERMKADLITNVSHDLKTPLTSIINYVDLLKMEIPETAVAQQHISVLEEKSHRMKILLEDLVEVSRLTSGTVKYDMVRIDFVELLYEIGGEFDERFETRGLTIVTKLPRLPIYIEADGRQLCRAIENLYTNAAKYAKENTHVSVVLSEEEEKAVFQIKNVMEQPILLEGDEDNDLTERFVRGDKSRTTEGSGLGLSITKEIITQMGGTFSVTVNDDFYTATISFEIS